MLKKFVLALTLVLVGWFSFSAWSIAVFALESQETRVDAIIVLGAAAWGLRPSPVFRERINHAIDLYHRGYASTIIFTGGKREGDLLTESEVARDYAIDRGVDPTDILLETSSTSTIENLANAQSIAQVRGLQTFILVSDPLHMKRAVLIAQDVGLPVYSSPTPTSRYRTMGRRAGFLLREIYYYHKYLLARQIGLVTFNGAAILSKPSY